MTLNYAIIGNFNERYVFIRYLGQDDTSTLYKCLCIACEMLKEVEMKKLSPTLQTMVDTLVSLKCTASVV